MELIEERQQIVAIPLEQGRFLNEPATGRKHHQASQSLWSRDGFSMGKLIPLPIGQKSQSLWGRDGFSIQVRILQKHLLCVAIPLEQGRFFNKGHAHRAENPKGRNPFGVGTVFQYESKEELADMLASQSLWSRDGFSIMIIYPFPEEINVAIPLEQGRFFNPSKNCSPIWTEVEIPLEQGRFINIRDYYGAELVMSQSLWSRDGFSIKPYIVRLT